MFNNTRTPNNRRYEEPKDKEFEERVLLIRRVVKKTTGGNKVTFSSLVVIGNKKGKVGVGLGSSAEVPAAIKKAITAAHKNIIFVPLYKSSIPHMILLKYKAAKVLLKPAPLGTGLKVGSVARAILELAGVENASGKIIRSRNQIANTYAIIEALKKLKPRITAGETKTVVEKTEEVMSTASESSVKVADVKKVKGTK